MVFNNSTLTGLLNNINHEKTKYITMLYKMKKLLELKQKDGSFIIRNQVDKLLLTDDPVLTYENVKFTHPIIKIFHEFLTKTDGCVNGSKYFIKIVTLLIDQFMDLLDNGVTAKHISNTLRDLEYVCNENSDADVYNLINSVIKNNHISTLLKSAIDETESFDTEKIRIIKINTSRLEDSCMVNGLVVPNSPSGKVTKLVNTSIAVFNCPLDIERPECKGTILMKTADELLNYTNDENNRIKALADGLCVNCVVVNGTVNKTFLDFCNMRQIMILKIFNKFDMLRIARAVESPIYTKLTVKTTPCKVNEVCQFKEGNKMFTKIEGSGKIKTILLKHPITEVLDDLERKINKVLNGLIDKKMAIDTGKITIKDDNVIANVIKKVVNDVDDVLMVQEDRNRTFRYSLEFLAMILEVNDYLLAQKEQLQIKQPPKGHFEEDH